MLRGLLILFIYLKTWLIFTKMMKSLFFHSSLIKSIKVFQDRKQEESIADKNIEKGTNGIQLNSEEKNATDDIPNEKLLSAQEFEVLDLSNYNPNSVNLVFLSLNGFPQIIEACNSFSDLYGCLKICDEYGIRKI